MALESRAETAENERAVAVEQMRVMTPRPGLSPTAALPNLLKGHSLAKLEAALQMCRSDSSPSLKLKVPTPALNMQYCVHSK